MYYQIEQASKEPISRQNSRSPEETILTHFLVELRETCRASLASRDQKLALGWQRGLMKVPTDLRLLRIICSAIDEVGGLSQRGSELTVSMTMRARKLIIYIEGSNKLELPEAVLGDLSHVNHQLRALAETVHGAIGWNWQRGVGPTIEIVVPDQARRPWQSPTER